jgi:hypothetical protein
VAGLISRDTIPLRDRLSFLSTIGTKLPDSDRKAILDWIGNTPPPGLSPDDWFTLANDVLQALRNQQPATPIYTDRLLALWHDRDLDPTLRDYALQQLREWVADGDTRSMHEERPEKLALIREAFLHAATPGHADCDPQSTTTGTALLALDEWTGSAAPAAVRVEPTKLDEILLSHIRDEAAHRGVRATALQIAARRKMNAALPLARELSQDASQEAILRLAAISLLGTMGTEEDRKLLQTLGGSSQLDPLILGAVASALRQGESSRQ